MLTAMILGYRQNKWEDSLWVWPVVFESIKGVFWLEEADQFGKIDQKADGVTKTKGYKLFFFTNNIMVENTFWKSNSTCQSSLK